jgi:hypothetical protein
MIVVMLVLVLVLVDGADNYFLNWKEELCLFCIVILPGESSRYLYIFVHIPMSPTCCRWLSPAYALVFGKVALLWCLDSSQREWLAAANDHWMPAPHWKPPSAYAGDSVDPL